MTWEELKSKINSKIESTLSWINDAEKREDFNESSYYEGKLSAYREILQGLEGDE